MFEKSGFKSFFSVKCLKNDCFKTGCFWGVQKRNLSGFRTPTVYIIQRGSEITIIPVLRSPKKSLVVKCPVFNALKTGQKCEDSGP